MIVQLLDVRRQEGKKGQDHLQDGDGVSLGLWGKVDGAIAIGSDTPIIRGTGAWS